MFERFSQGFNERSVKVRLGFTSFCVLRQIGQDLTKVDKSCPNLSRLFEIGSNYFKLDQGRNGLAQPPHHFICSLRSAHQTTLWLVRKAFLSKVRSVRSSSIYYHSG